MRIAFRKLGVGPRFITDAYRISHVQRQGPRETSISKMPAGRQAHPARGRGLGCHNSRRVGATEKVKVPRQWRASPPPGPRQTGALGAPTTPPASSEPTPTASVKPPTY